MMQLQVKEVHAEMNLEVEPGNYFAKVMMIWEVEIEPGHEASMHLMQQSAAAAAANISAVAAVAFPLPTGLHMLAAVNLSHDLDLEKEDEDCCGGAAAGHVLGKAEQVVELSDY